MIVRWTRTALRDLQSLHGYIRRDNPGAADAYTERILAAIDLLPMHPGMGRPGRVKGTRELVVAPYIVVYRVHKETIGLAAIIHAARRWPDSFKS